MRHLTFYKMPAITKIHKKHMGNQQHFPNKHLESPTVQLLASLVLLFVQYGAIVASTVNSHYVAVKNMKTKLQNYNQLA